ncbi:TPA: chromosome partitioning protein ParB, partial [Bacillus cereus]
ADQARKSEQLTRKQLEELEQQAPTIVEKEVVKEVEIVPNNLLNEIDKLKDEASFYKQKADALSRGVDDIQLEESSMNYIANKNVHNLIAYMDEFLKDAVVSSLMRGSIATASDATKILLDSRIEAFQEFLH